MNIISQGTLGPHPDIFTNTKLILLVLLSTLYSIYIISQGTLGPHPDIFTNTKLILLVLLSTLYSIYLQFLSLFAIYDVSMQHMMLVNVIIDISGCNRGIFQGCRLHWPSFFLMTELKQN